MYQRDSSNRLTADSEAALAIVGMPQDLEGGTISTDTAELQKMYLGWLGVQLNDEGHVVSERWFTWWRKLRAAIGGRGFTISRRQVAVLARYAAKSLMDARAGASQKTFYESFLVLNNERRELMKFLEEHFGSDLANGQATERSLMALIKEIMLRSKEPK